LFNKIWSSITFPAKEMISFWMAECFSIEYPKHIFFIHLSFVDGHLDWVHHLAIVSMAAINISVLASLSHAVFYIPLGIYPGWYHSVTLCLSKFCEAPTSMLIFVEVWINPQLKILTLFSGFYFYDELNMNWIVYFPYIAPFLI
jgi:hypothetical protein